MKKTLILSFGLAIILSVATAPTASALSCLPTDEYLKEVVGDENVVMFTGTAVEQMSEKNYTAEVVTVDTVKQGYVEGKVFVYHQKDETWGYLCNAGPGKKGDKGFYVAVRDEAGKYNVTQRLIFSEMFVGIVEKELKEAEIVGEKIELTTTDKMEQIITTIQDLYEEIKILFKEYKYWMGSK